MGPRSQLRISRGQDVDIDNLVGVHEHRNMSESNESCDISPENEANLRRAYGHQMQEIAYEEMDKSDLSSMNPLVTPGIDMTDRGDNRCSLFEANNQSS